MISIVVDEYTLDCHQRELPLLYGDYVRHARLVEEFDREGDEGENSVFAFSRGLDWPFLVVTQRYKPAGGFSPSILLVPETRLVFIGVGERLLAYELDGPSRLWEDFTNCGLWSWTRHREYIVMSAELELAAWDINGRKRWTTYVEPPWEYRVTEETVHLDVMGRLTSFPLAAGPPPLPR